MEETIFSENITRKVYSEKAVRLATFLGGPLVTGYLLAENFKNLGEQEKIAKTWIFSILATIVIIIIAFMLPSKTPSQLLPFAYTFAAYYLMQYVQGAQIKNHLQNGGQVYSIWRSVLIGLIGLVVIVVLLLGILLLTNTSLW